MVNKKHLESKHSGELSGHHHSIPIGDERPAIEVPQTPLRQLSSQQSIQQHNYRLKNEEDYWLKDRQDL